MGNKHPAHSQPTTTHPNQSAVFGDPSVRSPLAAIPRALLLEPDKLLNARQRQLVVKAWKRAHKTGLDSVGTNIFLHIFRADPGIKRLFALERVAGDQLKFETRFQAHAHTLTRTLGVVVSNIDDLGSVARYMQDLGKRHVQFQEVGLKPEHWEIFAEAISECAIEWPSGMRGRETAAAWRLLVAFLVEEMRSGYGERLKDCGILQNQRAYSGSCPAIVSPRDIHPSNC